MLEQSILETSPFHDLSQTLQHVGVIHTLCCAAEFSNIKVREEEMEELEDLMAQCPLVVRGGLANKEGKANVLAQAYISGLPFSLQARKSQARKLQVTK